jgi:sugar-specific transcriptional regulator TrmB
MRVPERIKQIGLSEKEAAVYLAALEIGRGTITEITQAALQKRPTVYLALDRLEMLGLVSRESIGKKKLWSAVNPRRLKELAEFRATQIEEIMPELTALYKDNRDKPSARVLEGIAGVRIAYHEAFSLLNSKEEGLWIGDTGTLHERFPEVLAEYNRILRQVHNPHIRELIHGGAASKVWANEMQKKLSKNHSIKYFGEDIRFGSTDQLIIGNKIMSFSFGKEIFVLIVESKELAQTQRGLFELIWKKV